MASDPEFPRLTELEQAQLDRWLAVDQNALTHFERARAQELATRAWLNRHGCIREQVRARYRKRPGRRLTSD